MDAFQTYTGLVAPLDAVNVDTDQIVPKEFLKRIERAGFGEFLFFDWRRRADGSLDPTFSLNEPRYQGASVLLARRNFGCGSSREHAPWALLDFGFRAIIAPSFGDIFRTNCLKNGIVPVVLSQDTVAELFRDADRIEGYRLTIDLVRQVVVDPTGRELAFEMDAFRRRCLMDGLDDIGWTLQFETAIQAYEAIRDGDPT